MPIPHAAVPAGLADAAGSVFGDEMVRAQAYAELLATRGTAWGLIGPREVERLWERHLLNSVAVAEATPKGALVVDVGSGAGLPGIPLALARPDVRVTLLEPLLRRATFLTGVVAELDLSDRVRVVRGRAGVTNARDPLAHRETYEVVVSRAVAALPRLLDWCAPLLAGRGTLVAMKGATAHEEVRAARAELRRMRMHAAVRAVQAYRDADPTWLVICSR